MGLGVRALIALLEGVLALEPGQLVDGDIQLVGDPGVRAALTHPRLLIWFS